MRVVKYVDKHGYIRVRLVRDNDPDRLAEKGIPCDPPDFTDDEWMEIKRDLYNLRVERGLLSLKDVTNTQSNLRSSIQDVLFHRLLELYKQMDNKK